MRTKLFNILKVVISAGMLAYVLLTVNLRDLGYAILVARWGYLALAAGLAIGGVALRAVRWQALLRALGIAIPLRRLVKLYFVGTFFNIFLPTGFGGDAIRMIELARYSKQTPEAIGTVLVDRATGLWMLFAMALAALPFGRTAVPPHAVAFIAIVAVVGLVGGWLLMGTRLLPWLGARVRLPAQEKLERFYHAVSGCGYKALGQALGISLLFNLLIIVVNWLIAMGLNVHLPVSVFFLFTSILSLALMLPSVGGLGVREEAYKQMYGVVGVPGSVAVAMSLTTFLLQSILPGVIGGLLYAVEGATDLRGRESKA
jgi:uncharacterized membrane protein YbhN (UPF0104 family)